MLANTIFEMEQDVSSCMVAVDQKSPAPFAVHLRSLLMLFCYTCPFTMINLIRPVLMVPAHFALTWSFLGVEFCSREMEYPFGKDMSDIPLRKILESAKHRVQQAGNQTLASEDEVRIADVSAPLNTASSALGFL